MTPIQRSIIVSLLATVVFGMPAALPGPVKTATLFRVAPAVRRIILRLRQLEIPAAWRQKNWSGSRGQGSCVHAAFVHLLHWQGQHATAEWWASRYGDGETPAGLAAKLDAAGLRYAETRSGDESFLRWAVRTRRGAAVVVQNGAHMVNLVGVDEKMPQDAEPLRRLCRLLFERTTPSAAEAPLLKLVAREPSDPAVHHNLGTVYLSQRRFEAAARCFLESLRLRPNSSATRGQLAAALAGAGMQGT